MSNKNWLQESRQSFMSADIFHKKGWINDRVLFLSEKIRDQLNFKMPRRFEKALDAGDDSIFRQFIPSEEELSHFAFEKADPIGDEVFSKVDGVIHRYKDRVLLKPTLHCAVYCRFCFRKEKVSQNGFDLKGEKLVNAIQYIKDHKEVREVVLSGGDPLSMTDKRIQTILELLDGIPHLRLIRFHTRIPTILPSRVNDTLLRILKNCRKTIWIVAHINSLAELDLEAVKAIQLLVGSGIPLMQQGVLLKDINDSEKLLEDLFLRLVELKIKPYYLHYPDLARGTNHFRIPLKRAIEIMANLRGNLPGYAIPQLCVDIPLGGGKVVVGPQSFGEISDDIWEFVSPLTGKIHRVAYK